MFELVLIIFGIMVVIAVIQEIAKDVKNNKIPCKYIKEGFITRAQKEQLPELLLKRGYEALRAGRLNSARTYFEDSISCGCNAAELGLYLYYRAAGKNDQAGQHLTFAMIWKIPEAFPIYGELLDKEPTKENLKVGEKYVEEAARNNVAGSAEALAKMEAVREALTKTQRAEQLAQALSSWDETLREAKSLLAEGKPEESAARLQKLYAGISDHVTAEERPRYTEKLSALAWHIAEISCEAKKYDTAMEYLGKEDCSRFRDFYYLRALAAIKCSGGGWLERMEQALKDAKKAEDAGIPGAGELKEDILSQILRHYDKLIAAEKQNIADLEFEEKHGVSPWEYQEQRRAAARKAAEEQAKSAREAELRVRAENMEREADLLSGGDGASMEERSLRGEISYADYLNYNDGKEKIIKKKSE